MATSGFKRQKKRFRKIGDNQWQIVEEYVCADSASETYGAAWFDSRHLQPEADMDTHMRCRDVQIIESGYAPGRCRVIVTWESVRNQTYVRVVPDIRSFSRKAIRDTNNRMIEGYDGARSTCNGKPTDVANSVLTVDDAIFDDQMANRTVKIGGTDYTFKTMTSTTVATLNENASAEANGAIVEIPGFHWVLNRGRNVIWESFPVIRLETTFRGTETEWKTRFDAMSGQINSYNSTALPTSGTPAFAAKRLLLMEVRPRSSWHDANQWDVDMLCAYNTERDWDTHINSRPFEKVPVEVAVEAAAAKVRTVEMMRLAEGTTFARNPYGTDAFTWLAAKTWSWS